MRKKKYDVRWMTGVAMMAAVVVLLASTPLGMIQLPVIKATTTHIPVILGAILLGPMAGCILGAVFGISSMVINTITPGLLSFAFSPFLSPTATGAVKAVWISVGCRTLVGLVSGWLWVGLKRLKLPDLAALPATALVGSAANTVFVMGSIYFLLRPELAAAKKVSVDGVLAVVTGIIAANGIPEAIAAVVLVTALGKILLHVVGRRKG